MNIIIAGVGKGGGVIMRQLLAGDHSLTVIDSDEAVLEHVAGGYDIMTVCGSCTSTETLKSAGVEQADLLISYTGSDTTNLLCCFISRKLNPTLHTIPRVRNPEYLKLASDFREDFGISMIINPDRDAAHEIYMKLQFPEFLQRETFAKGRVEIVQLKLPEKSKLNGVPISGLAERTGCKLLVCAIMRDGKIFIPHGEGVLQAGDEIYVTAPNDVLSRLIRNLGIQTRKIKNIMIIGGERISLYLAQSLADTNVRIKIIENDPKRSSKLAELLPRSIVITGDGSSQDILDREGISGMDALVTLTGLDEVNMVVSMYGSSCGVGKVITKLSRMESPQLLSGLNLGSVISSTHLSSTKIAQYARAMKRQSGAAQTVHPIAGGQVEALEFVIEAGSRYTEIPLRKLSLRKDMLITCIMHGRQTIIPDGSSMFNEGDTVVVVAPAETEVNRFDDIFD